MKFSAQRLYDAGMARGGMNPGSIVSGDIWLFAWPIKCAGIRLQLEDTVVYLSRDEALEVASCLQIVARDG